jgi:hypothetical protein
LYLASKSSFPALIGVAGIATETVQDIVPAITFGFYQGFQTIFDFAGNMTVTTSANLNTLFGVTNEITVRCMNPAAETVYYCDLHLAPNNALFVGDSLFGRAHMYTGGDVTSARFCMWHNYLDMLCNDTTLSATTTVYVGHGTVANGASGTPNWYTLAFENKQYLTFAENLFANSCNVTTATFALTDTFPTFSDPSALALVVYQQVPNVIQNVYGCASCVPPLGAGCSGNIPPACIARSDMTCFVKAQSAGSSVLVNIVVMLALFACVMLFL